MTLIDIEAACKLLGRVERASEPNIHRDIELWALLGSAEPRDAQWSDRLSVDPVQRCNGQTMRQAIEDGVPAASIRTSWKVPALTASQDAATALIRAVLPDAAWGVSVEPAMQLKPPFDVKYHAYVAEHWPMKAPGKWWGESEYADGAALALCAALLKALVSQAETGVHQ